MSESTSGSIDQIQATIKQAMPADLYRFRRRLRQIKEAKAAGKPFDRNLRRLGEDATKSAALLARRRAGVPKVTYDEQLPVTARREEIAAAISQHQVVVVCGETGSGKSTQLPKICLEMGRGVDGLIGHTQPRRIAARSVASRIADELRTPLGHDVGYKVRFSDTTRAETYIKLMTDGILLAESQHDRFFNQYDTIILDEAHERSLNIDFLLGYLKRVLPSRPDLRIIITSATIDAERFAHHFGTAEKPAPVIEVSGRMYPVEVRYRPLDVEGEPDDAAVHQAIASAVEELAAIDTGDMLIFLPTERDIRETATVLRGRRLPGDNGRRSEITPLYARLSAKEQNKVFNAHSYRRIVLATNVAESSLTVPGIRYVVDTGTARISRYAPRSKVQRLPVEAVSQASADQRKGRCGRVGPGVCIRLFSEDDYLSRDQYTTPEIRRTNLASVILQTKALKLGAIEDFPFIDPPNPEHISDGYRTLFELGAIDDRRELTDLGRRLARLPVDPRIARMVLAGEEENCLNEVLIIAAALEVQDPRERPVDKREQADEQHARHAHEESDFFTYLNLWDFYHKLKQDLSRNQLNKACRQSFLSQSRMREWLDTHRQLKQLIEQIDLKSQPRRNQYGAIHRALLTGLLSSIAHRTDAYEYTGAGSGKFHLWPGSTVFQKRPAWIMAGELVETTRRYARTVAKIDPAWIEPLAGHLVKHSYSDPYWSSKAGAGMVHEKVTLFGLPVVARRSVKYGPIDCEAAREMYIQHGLVEGDLKLRAKFLEHNLNLLTEVENLGAKTRSRDFIVDEYTLHAFYNARLPEHIYDTPRFNKWRKKAEGSDPQLLFMTPEDVMKQDAALAAATSYPDDTSIGRMNLPLAYRFEPGDEEDGVTITTPVEGVKQLTEDRLGWMVPGLLEEKIVALIRSLPKAIRRTLVPAPDTARDAAALLKFGETPFLQAVAEALSQVGRERISPADFRVEKLPLHLRMNVRVVDESGEKIAESRDLNELRQLLGEEQPAPFAEIDDEAWSRDGVTSWDFDQLPESVHVNRGGVSVPAFPALIDNGDSVSLRLLDSQPYAQRQTHAGVLRLIYLAEKKSLLAQVNYLPDLKQTRIYAQPVCPPKQLDEQLAMLIASRAYLGDNALPSSGEEFAACISQGRDRSELAVQEVLKVIRPLFETHHQARLAQEKHKAAKWEYALIDIRSQMKELTPDPQFMTTTPWRWLQHFPRYFRGVASRLEKIKGGGLPRDQQSHEELAPLWRGFLERREELLSRGQLDEALQHYRWMLEEYRISLYAQQLGASITVSAKRLDKQWRKVQI